jgi:sec-independent protein translocase protein TatA
MPFHLGPLEMVFVVLVLLLLFGGRKLPELGRGLGRGIFEFKRTVSDVTAEIRKPVEAQLPPAVSAAQLPASAERAASE